jgi:hypothetical protein
MGGTADGLEPGDIEVDLELNLAAEYSNTIQQSLAASS